MSSHDFLFRLGQSSLMRVLCVVLVPKRIQLIRLPWWPFGTGSPTLEISVGKRTQVFVIKMELSARMRKPRDCNCFRPHSEQRKSGFDALISLFRFFDGDLAGTITTGTITTGIGLLTALATL